MSQKRSGNNKTKPFVNERIDYRTKRQVSVQMFGNECSHCGRTHEDHKFFEFMHKHPTQQNKSISKSLSGSLIQLIKDLKKYEIICPRCHLKLHGWFPEHPNYFFKMSNNVISIVVRNNEGNFVEYF
jgi:hypothetical protein